MIRKLTADDRQTYLALANEFYGSPAVLHAIPEEYFERTFDEMMRSDDYVEGFMLEWDGETAGYGLISKSFSQEAGGMQAWLEELYVRPAFQGRGLGKAFFHFYEGYAPEMRRFRLEVEQDNTRALELYKRLGYEEFTYYQMVKERQEQ